MSQIDGGHLVAKALKNEGVEYIFSLSGAHIRTIYDGCVDEGIGIIDVRHEQAAAFAAEGWAKVTGRPGVCVATGGPGVPNTVTAVANAFRGSSPMIVIGGGDPVAEMEMGHPQQLSHIEYMQPITKWARRVLETRRIPEYLSIAFREAIGPKPGPVFLEVPRDVAEGLVDEADVLFPTRYRTEARPQGDPVLVREAAILLSTAQRPLLMAGSSVWWSQAAKELREFVESVGAPLFLNAMGRGSIRPEHPLLFSLARRFALSQADVVALIGTPLDFRLGYGRPPAFGEEAKVIQIDFEATDIGKNRPIEVGITGDVRAVLGQITQEIQGRPGQESEWLRELREWESSIRKEDEPALNSNAIPIHPLRLCREIRDFLGRDATVIGDGGDIVSFAARALNIYYPGHWLDPGPMGCLGVGTGYAMAAKLARPQEQVLIVSGDGSFGLNGMEFDTMARHNIPVVSVIGNDGAWGQEKHGHIAQYGRAVGAELRQGTRYDRMVESLGGHGEYVERPQDIRPALERAFASGKPACVNVLTDPTVAYARRQ
ncbi:MAG: acetolactate synthase [Dehalococcoidia bacterium]